jgi:hypothetical protein
MLSSLEGVEIHMEGVVVIESGDNSKQKDLCDCHCPRSAHKRSHKRSPKKKKREPSVANQGNILFSER